MQKYTGAEYLMIDAATHYTSEKLTFGERIQWAKSNMFQLEELLPEADNKPQYLKAVMAIRDTQRGVPIGHMVGLDASSSGIQVMSAAMGCEIGAMNTGLVDPNRMPDAYSTCTQHLNAFLGSVMNIPRKDAKDALMTFMYGSKLVPLSIFGEDTPELAAFHAAAEKTAPEAYKLRNALIDIWQPYAAAHSWNMPDGFHVHIPVMESLEDSIKVPRLDSSFTVIHKVNQGKKSGVSLAANVVHSIDAMIVREMGRRCMYSRDKLTNALQLLALNKKPRPKASSISTEWFLSLRHVDKLNEQSVQNMAIDLIARMENLIRHVLAQSKSFELVCVHDEFKAHPNNLDTVRYWYKEILAEIADSQIIQYIVSQIVGKPVVVNRASNTLGKLIRNSNYGLG